MALSCGGGENSENAVHGIKIRLLWILQGLIAFNEFINLLLGQVFDSKRLLFRVDKPNKIIGANAGEGSELVVGFDEFENFSHPMRVGLDNFIEVVADYELSVEFYTSESFEKCTSMTWQNCCCRDSDSCRS